MEGIIFIGIQASGKSTFYERHFRLTHVRISLDMLKTRHREMTLLKACLETTQPFVIDNTNPTLVEREKYIQALRKNKMSIKGYYFQSSLTACVTRNEQRRGNEVIPEVGIRSTYNKLTLPSFEEGFDELFYVSLEKNEFIVKEWNNEI